MSNKTTGSFASGISRRRFVKVAGAAAAALSVPASMRMALAQGENVIRIGFVNARSGPLRPFSEADEYVLGHVNKALEGGIEVGGKRYGVAFVLKDTQSNPVRGSQVTKDLIGGENVDLVITSSTPETVNPVADACEAAGVPCISTVAPWEAFYFGRGAKPGEPSPFKWTYHFSFGVGDFAPLYADQWSQAVDQQKGRHAAARRCRRQRHPRHVAACAGKARLHGRRRRAPTRTASPTSRRRSISCARLASRSSIPSRSRTTFRYSGARRHRGDWPRRSRSCQLAKAGLFEAEMEALGAAWPRLASGAYWHRAFPFTSPITGLKCDAMADGFEKATGKPWSQQVGAPDGRCSMPRSPRSASSGDPKDKRGARQGDCRR